VLRLDAKYTRRATTFRGRYLPALVRLLLLDPSDRRCLDLLINQHLDDTPSGRRRLTGASWAFVRFEWVSVGSR
jgi:hypothetical protein